MFVVIFCSLFVFLGMYIGKRWDLKDVSINTIFGLFLINTLVRVLPVSYNILYNNYHSSTLLFVIFGCILGYVLMLLSTYKYEDSDNISIFGFTLFNSFLLYFYRFSLLFVLINILYYIMIGIYVKNSRSWIYILIGSFLGFLISFIGSWTLGYLFTIIIGTLVYFIKSVYSIVFKNTGKKCLIGLIIGMLVAFLGAIL